MISIHAPLAGCDAIARRLRAARRISIHAPLAGCDRCGSQQGHGRDHFNPRTPCGVRHAVEEVSPSAREFQSTHPLRGATTPKLLQSRNCRFQSTHPLRGATVSVCLGVKDLQHFNPRTPCGVRLHAGNAACFSLLFQSTHPLRGATTSFPLMIYFPSISIHAPLAGCDALYISPQRLA